jgi:hypothetical protein
MPDILSIRRSHYHVLSFYLGKILEFDFGLSGSLTGFLLNMVGSWKIEGANGISANN